MWAAVCGQGKLDVTSCERLAQSADNELHCQMDGAATEIYSMTFGDFRPRNQPFEAR